MPNRKCVHRWLIDPPAGPTSTGKCSECGETREFTNSETYNSWRPPRRKTGRDKSKSRRRR